MGDGDFGFGLAEVVAGREVRNDFVKEDLSWRDLLGTESRDWHGAVSTSSVGSIEWCRDPVDRQVIWILRIGAPGL